MPKKKNPNVPKKKRMRVIADELWSRAIRDDWANRCPVCGRRDGLNAHHLIPRKCTKYRYELINGICLCSSCHQFCPKRSPHQNAGGWLAWLKAHYQERHDWYMSVIEGGRFSQFDGTVNEAFYCDAILNLKQYVEPEDYERIVGIKFSRWLEEQA